jgi:hypothetical protein
VKRLENTRSSSRDRYTTVTAGAREVSGCLVFAPPRRAFSTANLRSGENTRLRARGKQPASIRPATKGPAAREETPHFAIGWSRKTREGSIVKERQAACSGQLTVVSGQLQSRQEATPRLHDSVPVYMLASGFSATCEDFLILAFVSSVAMGK